MSKPVTEAELAKMEETDKLAIEAEWSFKDWRDINADHLADACRNGEPVQICKQYEGADWVGVAFIAGAHGTSLDAYTLVSAVKDRRRLIAEVRRLRVEIEKWRNSDPIAGHNSRVAEERLTKRMTDEQARNWASLQTMVDENTELGCGADALHPPGKCDICDWERAGMEAE